MACSSALKQINAKNLRKEACLMEWSQKMDLIVVVNDSNEVLINRLKWQCIWPQPLSKESLVVRGLAWRPDEKVIALAFNNGQIILLDVETKEELHTYSIEDDEDIASLSWTRNNREMATASDLEDDSMIDLPPLNHLSSSAPKPVQIESAHTNNTLNFLVIATTTGRIHLYAFGTLLTGTVNCFDFLPQSSSTTGKILNARLSSTFDKLFVQVQTNTNLHTLVLVNPFLVQHASSILELSRRHCQILDTMIYIDDVIQSIKEAWESVLLEMDTKLTKYSDGVPAGSVSADFIVLLMFGKASPELEYFLVHELTEKGLKKLGNCIELSYTTIQKLVIHPLQTAILHVCNHLNCLRGLSKNRFCYGDLLRETVIESALQRSGSFLVKAFELQQTIDQSTRDYKIFFRWLYSVLMAQLEENVPDDLGQMTQQELNYLAQFLATLDDDEDALRDTFKKKGERKFNLEKVGQYLEDKAMAQEAYPATDWQRMVAQNECIAKSPLVYKHEAKASLLQQYKAAKESVEVIFEQQQKVVSGGFQRGWQVNEEVIGGEGGGGGEVQIRSLNVQKGEGEEVKALDLFIYHLSEQEFLFYVPEDGNRMKRFQFQNIPFYYNRAFERAEFAFLDFQFYNVETVSMLLRCIIGTGGGGGLPERRVYFLQLPVSALMATDRSNFYEVMDPNCLKQLEGVDWRYLAVSGNRKVCSILSENRRRVCVYETEVDDDDDEQDEDEEMDNSNNLDVSK